MHLEEGLSAPLTALRCELCCSQECPEPPGEETPTNARWWQLPLPHHEGETANRHGSHLWRVLFVSIAGRVAVSMKNLEVSPEPTARDRTVASQTPRQDARNHIGAARVLPPADEQSFHEFGCSFRGMLRGLSTTFAVLRCITPRAGANLSRYTW